MEALILTADKKLECRETALDPVPGMALIRVAYAGICGSDLHRGYGGGAYHYPLIMGHEFSGVIEQSAENGNITAGTRVVVFPLLPCGRCAACETGDLAQCADYDYYGSRRNGGFAEYVYVPEKNLLPIPDTVPLHHAAMTEPCAVALHGVNKLGIRPGDIGAVFGGGPVGNMAAQWMRLGGCSKVFVVDIDPVKLDIARSMGFIGVEAQDGDPVTAIRRYNGGRGVDRVVEACGHPTTFRQAILAADRFGHIVFMGNISGDFVLSPADFSVILRQELTIRGTWNSRVMPTGKNNWTTAMEYMDGRLNLSPLISDTPSLSDGPRIFEAIIGRKKFFNKVIFKIGGDL